MKRMFVLLTEVTFLLGGDCVKIVWKATIWKTEL